MQKGSSESDKILSGQTGGLGPLLVRHPLLYHSSGFSWASPISSVILSQLSRFTEMSSTLAWKIPWKEERGRLQSMGSQSQTRLSDFTFNRHITLYKFKV